MGGFFGFHFRRKKQQQQSERRKSTLNGRYGSSTITCPSDGAYASPSKDYKEQSVSPATTHVEEFDSGVDTSSPPRKHGKKRLSIVTRHDTQAQSVTAHGISEVLGPASEIPIHPAYLMKIPEPISPTTTIASDSTWKGSRPSSPVRAAAPSFRDNGLYNPLSSHPPSISDLSAVNRGTSRTRQPRSRSHSRTRSTDKTLKTHASKPHLHDSTSSRVYPPPLNTAMGRARSQSRQRERTQPRTKNVPRSSSTTSTRRRSTAMVGLGNSNASKQTFENIIVVKDRSRDVKTEMWRHRYFDENSAREYTGYENDRRTKTPVSAEEELWPGRY